MSDVPLEVEDEPTEDLITLRKSDGEGYDNLSDWYYANIHAYAYMISRDIPKEFQVGSVAENEKHSCRQGIIAFKKCIVELRKQIKGEKPFKLAGIEDAEYNHLHQWYFNAFGEYMMDISDVLPEKFHKETEEEALLEGCSAAIDAFKRAISRLEKSLN